MASALGTVAGVVPQAPEHSKLELQLFPLSTHAGIEPRVTARPQDVGEGRLQLGGISPLPWAECPGLDRDLGVVMLL